MEILVCRLRRLSSLYTGCGRTDPFRVVAILAPLAFHGNVAPAHQVVTERTGGMERRSLGTTGWQATEIGFGTWNIGADWGDVSDDAGRAAVRTALDAGVNFIDTADVYGDGRSERHIASVLDEPASDRADVFVATKVGRRLDPHTADRYTYENLARFVDRSRENLGVQTLDLVQLHTPPTEVFYRPSVFDALSRSRDRASNTDGR